MEFKGTKGKWGYDIDESNSSIDLILPNNTVISYSRYEVNSGMFGIEREEMNANMKLISKAPEMLEMLLKLHLIFEGRIMPTEQHLKTYSIEIKELIKEATEIK